MPTGTLSAAATLTSVTSSAGIRRALVHQLRQSAALKVALVGGFHEGFAPQKAAYPFLVYQLIFAPIRRLWGSQMYITGFDVRIFCEQSVEANNIDTLLLRALDDAALEVDGQSTLLCQRVADLASPDVDDEGKKIFMVGGTYEIWTDQPH